LSLRIEKGAFGPEGAKATVPAFSAQGRDRRAWFRKMQRMRSAISEAATF